ncbi:YbaK/EbsC family protein [Aestuariimicrobium ganziense]|uniref:YbaK/EbsC family protein n=1 Tax=Aestuariimicrobium ganziense TaxID=2773677 RepID=UPI001944CEC9|nr:YbaK/EbsC family protein [Aestuariimicrobium ganziense]
MVSADDLPDYFAKLNPVPAAERPDLVAAPVAAALKHVPQALVFEIDPELADTAALCAEFDLPLETAANCVVIAGSRGEVDKTVACMALATTRVDVNRTVRKKLDVRKCSFAPMDYAVEATGMEYGGITPVGMPDDWPIWIDRAVVDAGWVCIGSGVRSSKLLLPGTALADLPGAEVVEGLAG